MQVHDAFVQKKMLYKFDKKIEQLFQSLIVLSQVSQVPVNGEKMVDESQQAHNKGKYLSREAILEQIEQLRFQNFKYRTALVSAKKDQTANEAILKSAEDQIIRSKEEVETLSRQLEHCLKCKRNKEEYNHLAESLKSSFEPVSVQDQKMALITKQIQEMQKKYEKQTADYEKKQKCLRLALSALKCVIDTEESQEDPTASSNNTLYQVQALNGGSQPKLTPAFGNSTFYNGPLNGSNFEQGEQLQGGEIQY